MSRRTYVVYVGSGGGDQSSQVVDRRDPEAEAKRLGGMPGTRGIVGFYYYDVIDAIEFIDGTPVQFTSGGRAFLSPTYFINAEVLDEDEVEALAEQAAEAESFGLVFPGGTNVLRCRDGSLREYDPGRSELIGTF